MVDKKELEELAEEFGIPLIEREGLFTLIGLKQFIEFKYVEETQCLQLI